MRNDEKESRAGELERMLGTNPRLYVTSATLRHLSGAVGALNESGKATLLSQAEAGMGTDSWHDEAYKALVMEGDVKAAILKVIEPLGGIETFVNKAKLISPNAEPKVGLGSKVRVTVSTHQDNGHVDEETLIVVGPVDKSYTTAANNDWVSCLSPVGLSLFGRKVGESFRVVTPGGVNDYDIISISPAEELQSTDSDKSGK